MLNVINIEKELNEVNLNFSREKIEQLDKDTICVLRKAIQHVEGSSIEIEKSAEKKKMRAAIDFWKAIMRVQDGEHVSKGTMQK